MDLEHPDGELKVLLFALDAMEPLQQKPEDSRAGFRVRRHERNESDHSGGGRDRREAGSDGREGMEYLGLVEAREKVGPSLKERNPDIREGLERSAEAVREPMRVIAG